ncbi:MAG: hypothetical protein N7Q72_01545, partial [Spiroplasma sp. Tabriz.8]|nr:hypothetical protein [Spiroplasma sp. Tabriz.8]
YLYLLWFFMFNVSIFRLVTFENYFWNLSISYWHLSLIFFIIIIIIIIIIFYFFYYVSTIIHLFLLLK